MIAATHPVLVSLSTDRAILIEGRISKGNWGRAFRVRKIGTGCTAEATDGKRPLRDEQAKAIYNWLKKERPFMLANTIAIVDTIALLAEVANNAVSQFPGMVVLVSKGRQRVTSRIGMPHEPRWFRNKRGPQ